jgi:long-chain acyl-CoA synthetase
MILEHETLPTSSWEGVTGMNLAAYLSGHARWHGDSTAVQLGAESITYAELTAQSECVAAGLRDLGVETGDRVVMFSTNRIEYVITYLAAARLGAIFAPIHASFQATELEYVLTNSTPTAVVAEAAMWERLQRVDGVAVPQIRVVLDRPAGDGLIAFDELRRSPGSVEFADVTDDAPVLICYTSGTTDRPHPVTRSHAVEIWNAKTYAEVWDYQASDRALVALPLSWVWGLSTLTLALLSVGATIVLHTEFDPRKVLHEFEASQISLFAGTMSMYTALLGALNEHSYDVSSLRRLYRGGEPINNEVVSALQIRLGLALTDAYAVTEAAPILAVNPAVDVDVPLGTVGRVVPGARVRIVDDAGNDVTPGEIGEAWLGGPGVMSGYWKEPGLTADRLMPGGWFRSGDLLYEGADGYYFVVGRSADVIIRNGAKIAPAEIESALTGLPGVRDSVAVGVPDEEFGESIVAFLVLEANCSISVDDVYAYLSDQIARFKLPSHIRFVDSLPIRWNEKRDRVTARSHALALLAHEREEDNDTAPASHLRLVK